MKNFWTKLNKPFFVLAPMADVTDCAFRQIIAKYGHPDVFWTEFVSADGLCAGEKNHTSKSTNNFLLKIFSARPSRPAQNFSKYDFSPPKKLLADLKFGENERPIVAQIFGGKPENIKKASALCAELGFDGIDINMGCPDKSVEKQSAGAACMKNPKLAREIIRAAKEGAPGLPISVKTRIGYNKNEIDTWIVELLKENLSALTVHLRTRKEMSLVPAHWDLMPSVVALRDKIAPETLIIGNGDAVDLKDAKEKTEKYGCDGIMLGRAIFGNPWLFAGIATPKNDFRFNAALTRSNHFSAPQNFSPYVPSLKEKLKVMIEHTKLFEKMLGGIKNFAIMKKHYKAYVNGFDGAKELRMKLMEAVDAGEVEKIVNEFLKVSNL